MSSRSGRARTTAAASAAAPSTPPASSACRASFAFDFDLAAASDDSFLTQFDYSDTDQLTSFARVRRTRAEEYIELGTIAFQSLTDVNESVDVPFVLPEFTYRRLRGAPSVNGRLGIELNSLGVLRQTGSNMLPRRRAGGLAA